MNVHNSNPKFLSSDRVIYQDHIPLGKEVSALAKGKKTILIYDINIKLSHKVIDSYDYKFGLNTGESLKQLNQYHDFLNKISKHNLSAKNIVFVAMGGGSLGDFVGFLASTYKRGCSLVHIPSTWLAAVDSAHGGKTALNISNYKNQIGSFYFANAIIISKKLLLKQPKVLFKSAMGEVAKTYLYDKEFAHNLKQPITNGKQLFEQLPLVIDAKYKIVKKDPFEIKKIRKILNLGHTTGHVFESHYKLAHGEAIKLGLLFSLNWSYEKGFITNNCFNKLKKELKEFFGLKFNKNLTPMSSHKFLTLLKKDKKSISSTKVDFVFIGKNTSTKVIPVSYEAVLVQAKKQGWVK